MSGALSSTGSSVPLLFLQVGNDPFQFSALFPLHGLQDLGRTLRLAHGRLSAQCLAVLLDEGMLVLPSETKKMHIGSQLGGEVSEHTRSKSSDAWTGGWTGLCLHGRPLKTQAGCWRLVQATGLV